MTRETEQLLAVANYYLAEAKRVLRENPELVSLTIGDISRRHRTRSLSPGEMVLAHFASAAVRLATICEVAGYRPTQNYRDKFYERSGHRKSGSSSWNIRSDIAMKPHEHLHLLLRDNVAHEEAGITNRKEIAADRVAVLKATTIDTCDKALTDIAKTVKKWA